MVSRKAISAHLWGNNWWSTYHPQSEFKDMLLAKVAASPYLSLQATNTSSNQIGDQKYAKLAAHGSDAFQRAKVEAQADSSMPNELH